MKKLLCCICFLFVVAFSLASCSKQTLPEPEAERETTVFDNSTEASSPVETGDHTHAFGEWKIVNAASCKQKGVEERVCACGNTEKREIDVLDHTRVVDEAVKSTCKEHGKTEGAHCRICNLVLVEQLQLPLSNHTYDDKNDASCNICGFVRPLNCKHTKTEKIPGVLPKCSKAGLTEGLRCSACKEIIKEQEEVKPTGHKETVLKSVSPTCTSDGLTEGKKCSSCNKILVEQQIITKTGHNYVGSKCTYCGMPEPSKGLEFTETQTGYAVSKIGTCKDEIIVIPEEYNGKKVVEILGSAFCNPDHDIKEFILPDTIKYVGYDAISLYNFFKLTTGKNTVFDRYAIDARGGCEIINRSSNSISQEVFSGGQYAPCVINNSDQSICQTTENGLVFIKSKTKYYLCDYVGKSDELVLPESFAGGKYEISPYCFYRSNTISKVTIGNGVIGIGQCAFADSSLREIDLRGNLDTIREQCFAGCVNLRNVDIPSNIKYLYSQCFERSGLENITIGENVEEIQVHILQECDNLDTVYYNAKNCSVFMTNLDGKRVVIGSGVQSIPKNFMDSNKKLTSVVFAENSSCTSIGAGAFYKTAITSIDLPASLTNLGSAAFKECNKLEQIRINSPSLTCTGNAFDECGAETSGISIVVDPKVVSLPSKFITSSKVTSLIFEGNSSCKTISSGFATMHIPNVTIPASVETLDFKCFDLATMRFAPGNENYALVNSCLISKKNATLLAVIDKNYVIPDYITTVSQNAFYGSGVQHIYIPDTVQHLENGSLNCASVVSVSLPFIGSDRNTPGSMLALFGTQREYNYIQIDTMPGFSHNKRYYIPPKFNQLTIRGETLGNGLSMLSMLKTLKIADTVKSISTTAFSNCKNITSIYFEGTEEAWEAMKQSGWTQYVPMSVNVVVNADIGE